MSRSLLDLRISVDYPNKPGVLRDFSLAVNEGEIVGLVGPSGEGKSTAALAILGLLRYRGARCSGEIQFQGRDLLRLKERELRRTRGKAIGLVPQSPVAALNPRLRLGRQLELAWLAHESGRPASAALMRSVSLPAEPSFPRQFPRSLSVGMAQRFTIALAILHRPALLIADECTSALDATTRAEILALLKRLREKYGMAILYISHDLASVAWLCDRAAILDGGRVVEDAPVEEIFKNPRESCTRRLIAAIPRLPGSFRAAGELEYAG
jgi:ABC-type glutathione transport system ATPase component